MTIKSARRGQVSRVIIAELPPTLNHAINESKKHWSKYAEEKSVWTDRVSLIIKQSGVKFRHATVAARFDWYWKDRRSDPDNISHGAKYLLDGMVEAGLLAGDGWKNVRRISHNFDIDKKSPRVEVILTEL